MDGDEVTVSDDDLATCVRVLEALATREGGISEAYKAPRCKPLRKAMMLYLDDMRGSLFHGDGPTKYANRKEKKRIAHAREQQEKAMDRAASDKARMRSERLRMLGALEESAAAGDNDGHSERPALAFVPDGAVDAQAELLPIADGSTQGQDGDDAPPTTTLNAGATAPKELNTLHSCYTCKRRFRLLHHFYADLCPDCAELNWAKRQQTAALDGKVFLVTGARVKIGFHAALKLLRCGASVLATSRFPADMATRFAAQEDAPIWSGRLQCYGLDLRDLSTLERFCAHLIARGQRLDGIINNACQTIRRPAAYYSHLLPLELDAASWSPSIQGLLHDHTACFTAGAATAHGTGADAANAPRRITGCTADAPAASQSPVEPPAASGAASGAASASSTTATHTGTSVQVVSVGDGTGGAVASAAAAAAIPSALWSQAPLWSAEEGVMQPDAGEASNFPVGLRDVNGQQVDTRRTNSWLLKLQDVSTPEAAEVLAINALAPFVLNSRLRTLLEACPSSPRFVVNVSAMEGKFYRYKTPNHPHTNMAKAALNMMTRTCAEELAACGILMNSVDTGWINDEKPLEKASAHAEAHHFQTPLDEIDAASRILDPIMTAANGGPATHGKFLKDYVAVEW